MILSIFVLLIVFAVSIYDYMDSEDSQVTSPLHNRTVFHHRNKNYGAYRMRTSYDRLMLLLIGGMIVLLAGALLANKELRQGSPKAVETPPMDTTLLSLNAPPMEQIETLPEQVKIEGKNEGVEEPAATKPKPPKETKENDIVQEIKAPENTERSVKDGAPTQKPQEIKKKSTGNEDIDELIRKTLEDSPERAKQDKIRKKMEEQKRQEQQQKNETSAPKTTSTPTVNPGDKPMVEWKLSGRTPHLNNEYYVRNPGYTCGKGMAGTVLLKIKVNSNGNVTSAIPISDVSKVNPCLVEQAVKYANMSRFSTSSTSSQEGTIQYKFLAQ